jgi:hypothetical protein
VVRHVFIIITSKNALHYILLLSGAGLAHLGKCCEHYNETSNLIKFKKFISRELLWSEELDRGCKTFCGLAVSASLLQ